MRHGLCVLAWFAALPSMAVDPTFLRRSVSTVPGAQDGYKPLFGAGDGDAKVLRGVTRYGELSLAPDSSRTAAFPLEELIYVVLDGTGELDTQAGKRQIKRWDYFYVGPATTHTLTSRSALRVLLMGFKASAVASPGPVPFANIEDVPTQTVSGHPPSTQYRLLLGTQASGRDRLRCAQSVTSLFVMEFAPGGTNIPHHHEMEEEIYFVLEGEGQMVAGGGQEGIEGKYPSQPGDAWFFRLNTTVGFYAGPKSRILAVRSRFPFPRAAGE